MHHLIFSSKFYRVSLFFPLCYQKKIASLSRELIAKINCYRGCGILPNRTHTKSWHSEFSITLLSLQPNPQLYERGSQVLMPLVGLCLWDCAYLCLTQDLVQLPSRWTLDDNDRHGHNHYYHQNSSHLLSTSFSDSVLSPQNNPQKEEEEDEYLFLTWESWVSERISNLIKVIQSINSGLYSIFVKYPGQINFIQHSLWNRQIEKKKSTLPLSGWSPVSTQLDQGHWWDVNLHLSTQWGHSVHNPMFKSTSLWFQTPWHGWSFQPLSLVSDDDSWPLDVWS